MASNLAWNSLHIRKIPLGFNKIQNKFIALFVVLLFIAVGIIGWFSFEKIEEAVISSSITHMNEELGTLIHKSEMFHSRAKHTMLFALENPVFKEYFSLPETRSGNRFDKDGVISLTSNQKKVRERLERWTFSLQKQFPIGETCLIDQTGQEHSRTTFGKLAPDSDLSSEEGRAPFFKPSLELADGQVHISNPYMSPDVEQWVFAYTSPIILDDGSVPAFYHFEMPVSLFQESLGIGKSKDATANSQHQSQAEQSAAGDARELSLANRMFIQDSNGLLIGDRGKPINLAINKDVDSNGEHLLEKYLPAVSTVSSNQQFIALMQRARSEDRGHGQFTIDGERYFAVFKRMPFFDWSLVEIKSYDRLLLGVTSLSTIRNIILLVGGVVMLGGILAVWYVSRHITSPLKLLTSAMHELEKGSLHYQVPVTSNDELGQIANAFNSMSNEIQHSQDYLNQEKRKLTTIIHTAREGIVVTDEKDNVVLINAATERLLDKNSQQIQSDGFLQLLDDPDYVESFLAKSGKDMPDTLLYKNRFLKFHAASIFDNHNTKIGSAALIRDITEEKRLEEELRKISFTDKLTGLFNRRWMEQFLDKEFNRAMRYKMDLSVLFFDVDKFKVFNDTHGHDVGDHVLESIGNLAISHFRNPDYPCRYGGEEFCIILTNTGPDGAYIAAEKFRVKIAEMSVNNLKVTVSIGVASMPQAKSESASSLVKSADNALYAAKRGGRNRVVRWDAIDEQVT